MCQLLGPAILQHVSEPCSDAVVCVCLQSCASSMMDLVIKQLWPILITHLEQLHGRRAAFLESQRSKVRSFRMIHPVLLWIL